VIEFSRFELIGLDGFTLDRDCWCRRLMSWTLSLLAIKYELFLKSLFELPLAMGDFSLSWRPNLKSKVSRCRAYLQRYQRIGNAKENG
jgi:hypothetical protein